MEIMQDVTHQLLKLYKEGNIIVQFKFKNKPNYIFEGEILELPGDVYHREVTLKKINDDSFFENPLYNDIHIKLNNNKNIIKLKLINGQIAFIRIDFIDVESIIPYGYQAERFYIREPITPEMREFIFKRDSYECQLRLEGCSKKAECCDHTIPVIAGGLSIVENLKAACNNCNLKKGRKVY